MTGIVQRITCVCSFCGQVWLLWVLTTDCCVHGNLCQLPVHGPGTVAMTLRQRELGGCGPPKNRVWLEAGHLSGETALRAPGQ